MIHAVSSRIQRSLAGRDPAIDFMRGLSIFVVVLLHFTMVYTPQVPVDPRVFSIRYWFYFSRNGYWGVSAFFVLSGYLITSGALARFKGELKNIKFFDFYLFRVARIVPPALLLVAANFVCDQLISDHLFFYHGNDLGFFDWLVAIFVLLPMGSWSGTDLFIGFSLGVMWSLQVEEAFYLFFPILMKSLRKTALIVAALVALVIGAIFYRNSVSDGDALFTYPGCFDLLALGGLVALFRYHYPAFSSKMQSKWLSALSLIYLAAIYLSWHDREITTFGPSMIGAGVAVFILSSKTKDFADDYSSLVSKTIRLMGLYSYEIYLSHIIVAQLMVIFVLRPLDQGSALKGAYDVYFMMTWATTFVVSALVSEFYSEPARHWIKKVGYALHAKFFGANVEKDVVKTAAVKKAV